MARPSQPTPGACCTRVKAWRSRRLFLAERYLSPLGCGPGLRAEADQPLPETHSLGLGLALHIGLGLGLALHIGPILLDQRGSVSIQNLVPEAVTQLS